MSILSVLVVSAVALLCLHLLAIPYLRRRVARDRTPRMAGTAGLCALASYVRGVLLVGTVTLAVLAGALWSWTHLGGADVESVASSLEVLRGWRDRVLAISGGWAIAGAALLLVGMGFHSYRSGKRRMTRAFAMLREREIERLVKAYNDDALEPLSPTREMKRIEGQLEALQAAVAKTAIERGEESPELASLIQRAYAEAQRLKTAHARADILRRVELVLDPDQVRLPQPRNLWERVQTFFFSDGLVGSLRRGARAVYLASLALLVPALLGAAAPGASGQLNRRIAELQDLQIRLSTEEARQDWERARRALGATETELPPEDEETILAFAALVEDELAGAALPAATAEDLTSVPYHAVPRSAAVAERILARGSELTNGRLAARRAMEGATDLGRAEQRLGDAYRRAARRAPAGPVGEMAAAKAREGARRSPAFRQRLRDYVSSFQRPAGRTALRNALAGQTLDAVLRGSLDDLPLPSASWAGGARAVSAVRTAAEARVDRLLADLASPADIATARQRLLNVDPQRPLLHTRDLVDLQDVLRSGVRDAPDTGSLLRALEERPPSATTRTPQRMRIPEAAQAVDHLHGRLTARASGRVTGLDAADALARYDDWFPSHVGGDFETPRGRMLDSWHGRAPRVSGPSAPVRMPTQARVSFARGRSFRMLRGFSRVGGVVIGREPERGAVLPAVRDLRWEEVDGDRLRLVLVEENGQEHRSAPYRKALVYHALLYAADGRLLAVTMSTASPLAELRILLHPTLTGTPLGQRVVDMDRFVDEFASDAVREEATVAVYGHLELYRSAWARRLLATDWPALGVKEESSAKLVQWAQGTLMELNKSLIAKGFAARAGLGDPERSPLSKKREFFDESLVSLMRQAAEEAESLQDYESRFESLVKVQVGKVTAARRAVEESRDMKAHEKKSEELRGLASQLKGMSEDAPGREMLFLRARALQMELERIATRLRVAVEQLPSVALDRWIKEPPTIEIWSGVRERAYGGGIPSLLAREGDPATQPFTFMLQVAFTSPPQFLESSAKPQEGAEPEERVEAFSDEEPWEFPALQQHIQETVLARVMASERHRELLGDVAEFTILQRLFRAALQGQLANDFPVERLAELTEACSSGPRMREALAREAYTPEWNVREGQIEGTLHQTLTAVLAMAEDPSEGTPGRKTLAEARSRVATCVALVDARIGMVSSILETAKRLRASGGPALEGNPEWEKAWNDYEAARATWRGQWAEAVRVKDSVTALKSLSESDRNAADAGSAVQILLFALERIERTAAALEIREHLGVTTDFRLTLQAQDAPLAPLQ